VLPNVFVAGSAKSGTKSLASYLRQHPDVFVPEDREPCHFAYPTGYPRYRWERRDLVRDLVVSDRDRYEALFAAGSGHLARCDFSTPYLYEDGVPERLATAVPDARIIIMVRQPVDRAYSAYRFLRVLRVEPLRSPAAAFRAEPRRIAENYAPAYRYLGLGRYGGHIKRFLDHFGRARVLVLLTEELDTDPAGTLRRIFTHLGVDPTVPIDTSRRENVRRTPRSLTVDDLARRLPPRQRRRVRRLLRPVNTLPTRLPPELHARLTLSMAGEIEKLATLLDRDLDHWLDPTRAHFPRPDPAPPATAAPRRGRESPLLPLTPTGRQGHSAAGEPGAGS